MTSSTSPLLETNRLVKDFPVSSTPFATRGSGFVSAVADVSLRVHQGEIFGLVGESGCGKTTLGRMISGLEPPTGGKIRFDGEDITRRTSGDRFKRARAIQLMFQDPQSSLDPRMAIGNSIREPLDIHRIGSREERRRRVEQLLGEVGLSPRAAERFPHEFSGGQRQRIGLARALALGPRLLIADEPVSALDVSVRAQILNLLGSMKQLHDLTYILISHDLSMVRHLADRVGVMYLGKLVEVGPVESIFRHPAVPYSAGLLSAIPIPDPEAERKRARYVPSGEPPSPVDPPSGCRYRTRCPRAGALCASEEPRLRRMTTGQFAACHFPLVDAEVETAAVGDG